MVKSHLFPERSTKMSSDFRVALSASKRFIWAIKQHFPMIFNLHFGEGGHFLFRGVWALPKGG